MGLPYKILSILYIMTMKLKQIKLPYYAFITVTLFLKTKTFFEKVILCFFLNPQKIFLIHYWPSKGSQFTILETAFRRFCYTSFIVMNNFNEQFFY